VPLSAVGWLGSPLGAARVDRENEKPPPTRAGGGLGFL